MTVFDLRCDRCGTFLAGPNEDEDGGSRGPFGVRFLYHPGDFLLKDDSGLACGACWSASRAWLGAQAKGRCSVCAVPVEHARSLHVHRAGDPISWQLCRTHAAEFLNGLRTVEPKLASAGLTFAGDWGHRAARGAT